MDKDKLIEFAKKQCEIFPEDSYMGKYLRETLKMLQAEPCEDAISKASVFEIMGNLMSIPYDLDRPINKKDVSESMNEIRALPPVKPTQNWIPVSERLPEKDVEVLATTEWGEVTIAIYCVTDWLIHEGDTNAETDEIVAWMPLPEPYTEKLD